MSISLPKGETNKGTANWSDVYGNDKALKEAGETLEGKFPVTNANLAGEITTAKLSQSKLTWYTPKVIATEETRENVAFGKLTTPDEIASVVLPENGLIVVAYSSTCKSSVSEAGKAALFLGANQLKRGDTGGVQEASLGGTTLRKVVSCPGGLNQQANEASADVTTGQTLSNVTTEGGVCYIFAAAGTYNISIQFRATSGKVTAKERKLWVATLG